MSLLYDDNFMFKRHFFPSCDKITKTNLVKVSFIENSTIFTRYFTSGKTEEKIKLNNQRTNNAKFPIYSVAG